MSSITRQLNKWFESFMVQII